MGAGFAGEAADGVAATPLPSVGMTVAPTGAAGAEGVAVVGVAVVALAGRPRIFVGAAAGVGEAAAGMESSTEACFCFKTAREMLVIMKTAARPVVTRESNVTEPRGPKAA